MTKIAGRVRTGCSGSPSVSHTHARTLTRQPTIGPLCSARWTELSRHCGAMLTFTAPSRASTAGGWARVTQLSVIHCLTSTLSCPVEGEKSCSLEVVLKSVLCMSSPEPGWPFHLRVSLGSLWHRISSPLESICSELVTFYVSFLSFSFSLTRHTSSGAVRVGLNVHCAKCC